MSISCYRFASRLFVNSLFALLAATSLAVAQGGNGSRTGGGEEEPKAEQCGCRLVNWEETLLMEYGDLVPTFRPEKYSRWGDVNPKNNANWHSNGAGTVNWYAPQDCSRTWKLSGELGKSDKGLSGKVGIEVTQTVKYSTLFEIMNYTPVPISGNCVQPVGGDCTHTLGCAMTITMSIQVAGALSGSDTFTISTGDGSSTSFHGIHNPFDIVADTASAACDDSELSVYFELDAPSWYFSEYIIYTTKRCAQCPSTDEDII